MAAVAIRTTIAKSEQAFRAFQFGKHIIERNGASPVAVNASKTVKRLVHHRIPDTNSRTAPIAITT